MNRPKLREVLIGPLIAILLAVAMLAGLPPLAVFILLVLLSVTACLIRLVLGKTVACPFCAEQIKSKALLCRFCGSKITT